MSDLAKLEKTVESGLKVYRDVVELLGTKRPVAHLRTFLDVALALAQIRERRLYKAGHKTWEDYCAARWGFTGRHGNRLIAAAEVADHLGPMGPKNERQARVLAGQAPEVQAAAIAAAGENPTARKLEEALDQLAGPEEFEKIQAEEEEALRAGWQAAKQPRGVLEQMGYHVGLLEKLIERLDLAERPVGNELLAGRLLMLAGRLQGREKVAA